MRSPAAIPFHSDNRGFATLDMLRKLLLVGVVVLVGRGSSAQLGIAIVLSFFFFSLQLSVAPYKLNQDNIFRASTECHVFLVLTVALMMRTEASSYDNSSYDWILSTSFIVLVPGAFVVTVASKARFAFKAQCTSGVDASFDRFRLGMAVDSDCVTLYRHFAQLRSELEPAGKRLWRNKELVAHLEPGQLEVALQELRNKLPKSQNLGFHFTDVDSARLILQNTGIRASTVGQLGGGVSVCLMSPVKLGWAKFGGAEFAKRVGTELWGSKWREVMPGSAPKSVASTQRAALCKELVRNIYQDQAPEKLENVDALLRDFQGREEVLLESLREKYNVHDQYRMEDPNKEWGKYSSKLEVLLVLRIPSQENRDKSRSVPGRSGIYIVPRTDCEPGVGADAANVYFPNREIEQVFILRAPDSIAQREQLDVMTQSGSARVLCSCERDRNGAMSNVIVAELNELEQRDDRLVDGHPSKPWCPVVASFTANVPEPLDAFNASMRTHQQIQDVDGDRQVWPENVARFSEDEMAAAIRAIDNSVPQIYSLGYFFTSADEAAELSKGAKGIEATVQPDGRLGVRVSLRSPSDLGWQKNAGGEFLDTAGARMYGPHWREIASKKLQAVLILGIPTDQLLANDGADTFVIPERLLVMDGVDKPYYSIAHVHKSYLLQRTTTLDHCIVNNNVDKGLQDLFARVDSNGDGTVTRTEATDYLRKERKVHLDEHSINIIWRALDTDGNGVLDISEFPRFVQVVDKEIARVDKAEETAVVAHSIVDVARKLATQVESTAIMDGAQVTVLRSVIKRLEAKLPGNGDVDRVFPSTEADVRVQLRGLKLKELKQRARKLGIDRDDIDDLDDHHDPLAKGVELVLAASLSKNTDPWLSGVSSLLGIDADDFQAALDEDDAQVAVLQLLIDASQKPPDLVLATLQAGGKDAIQLVVDVLDAAIAMLETHKRSSPRKARRSITDVIGRTEEIAGALNDSSGDIFCKSGAMKHLARLLADVQRACDNESSTANTLSMLCELMKNLEDHIASANAQLLPVREIHSGTTVNDSSDEETYKRDLAAKRTPAKGVKEPQPKLERPPNKQPEQRLPNKLRRYVPTRLGESSSSSSSEEDVMYTQWKQTPQAKTPKVVYLTDSSDEDDVVATRY